MAQFIIILPARSPSPEGRLTNSGRINPRHCCNDGLMVRPSVSPDRGLVNGGQSHVIR
jgi:hypothetical protein